MSIQLQEIQSIYLSQNRLVEGKDYVRAEWLKGDGSAYINTNYLLDFDDIKTSIFRLYNNYNQVIEGTRYEPNPTTGGAGTVFGYTLVSNTRNTYGSFFSPNGAMARWNHNIPVNEENIVIMSKNGITLNDSSIYSFDNAPIVGTRFKSVTPYLIFASWVHNWQIDNRRQKVDYKSFEIEGKLHLVPCQLLRSIPATLDANGIARSAGECGMVDSISGKFYGNVASSGSFSVEGLDESGTVEDTRLPRLHQIYRNKLVEGTDYMIGEWLKGDDNSPYISIPNTDTFSIKINELRITGVYATGDYVPNVKMSAQLAVEPGVSGQIKNYSGLFLRLSSVGVKANYRTENIELGEHVISKNAQTDAIGVFTDDVRHKKNATTDIDYVGTDIVFNRLLPKSILHIGYFTSATINLIPCKLLRSIPRNLDAQCKSRIAGECGMIDLISGRFYGNVAESGTFRLAWDEWLKDCSIQIAIPSECYTFEYTIRVDTTKLTSELVDFGFIKLSNTQIVYGDEDNGLVYTVDWGTNKWATLNIIYNRGAVATILNGTTVGTSYNTILDQNPHIQLYDIMQIKQINWSIMVDNIATTTTLTRYVNGNTGQQGLISDQDGTIIYAD